MSRERELYDPGGRRWYRGTAEKVEHYFDHTRSQWVSVAVVDGQPFPRCSCEKCAAPSSKTDEGSA